MKTPYQSLLLCTLVVLAAGCANFPVSTQTVALPGAMKSGDVIEIVIDVAREQDFPPPSKIDKPNGIVEFGNFGMSELGTTAMVRVKSDTQVEVTVKRGSIYVKLPVEQIANDFKAKLEERLRGAAQKGAKI